MNDENKKNGGKACLFLICKNPGKMKKKKNRYPRLPRRQNMNKVANGKFLSGIGRYNLDFFKRNSVKPTLLSFASNECAYTCVCTP